MKRATKLRPAATRTKPARPAPTTDVAAVVAWIKANADEKVRLGMARYGIPSTHAVGISVGTLQRKAKALGRDHALALALWKTGIYEARLLASMVGEPERMTPGQMESWCRDFDSWAVVDTVCFKLFDQCPAAWSKVAPWSKRRGEFQKRAGVVLLACLAAHDENADDDAFLRALPVLEAAAEDERNFVKKGVSWALRLVGRRSGRVHAATLALAQRLAASGNSGAAWAGRDAVRELTSPGVRKRVTEKDKKAAATKRE